MGAAMSVLIRGAKVITSNAVLPGHSILFGGTIQRIAPDGLIPDTHAKIIEAGGSYVLPGLIDLHIHGFAGHGVMDASADAVPMMAKALARNGVTRFLATTITMGYDETERALKNIRAAMKRDTGGAVIEGAHLEGPFINARFKGVHDETHIKPPDISLVEKYKDVIRIVTYAPELGTDFIKKAVGMGVRVSMGHTAATADEAFAGIGAGVTHVTHLFNAMSGIHHRNPGALTAALLHGGVTAELIADCVHVDPVYFDMVYRMKGRDRICLITDGTRAGGLPPGMYTLGGREVVSDGTAVRLPDGTLAGSMLGLNDAVRNFYANSKAELYEAVAMASQNPARVLGIDDVAGSLAEGKRADLFIADEKLAPQAVFVGGKRVH
jgi:N-acetylglucosamine-6-phosphate deacetylase